MLARWRAPHRDDRVHPLHPDQRSANWLLIFGHFGFPRLGLVGSGYASAINQWLMLLGLMAAVAALPRDDPAHRLRVGFAPMIADIRQILALGLPIAGLQGLEVGVFVTSIRADGPVGAEALAAHQIAISCASLTFMVPLGIGQAATVRVATERGAGNNEAPTAPVGRTRPRRAVHDGRGTCAVARRDADRRQSTSRSAIRRTRRWWGTGLQFLAIAALFQIVDGIQAVAAARCAGITTPRCRWHLPRSAIGASALPAAGAGLSARRRAIGWVGASVLGLAAVAVLLTLRLYTRARAAVGFDAAAQET